MVTLARSVFVRPKLDEQCPAWVRDLLPFAEQEHGLGISCDRIPQATLDDLEYFCPVPVTPKRQRKSGSQQKGKKYARTSGMGVFLACLPYAFVKQLNLFADAPALGTGEVAVLSLRKLADLAKKVEMCYDRVQRWMTILVTLGFIWRFREGRRTLYVIPLTAYAPRPSAEGVRTKLTALIHSQFVEIEQADGQVVRTDRCPEFTNLLLETRARFERRYQLAPSLDLDLIEDPTWEKTISDIQKALPDLTRNDLYTMLPIVVSHLLRERSAGKGRRFVLKGNAIESTFSLESPTDRQQTIATLKTHPQPDIAQKNGNRDRKRGTIESILDGQDSSPTATKDDSSEASKRDGKRRFNGETTIATERKRTASHASSERFSESVIGTSNLPLPASGSSLTFSSPELQKFPEERENTGVAAASGQEQGAEQKRWQGLAAELARIFDDQKSLKFYEGVLRTTPEQLVRAVFVKTLYQEQNGGFTKSAGAYFKYMWDQWKVYRTYAAACDKWNHWGNKRDPKGIPPNIHALVTLYAEETYTQIATNMGHRWPDGEQTVRLESSSNEGGHCVAMSLEEAQALVEALHYSASWYLRKPQLYQVSADVQDGFVVQALWLDGEVSVFATFNEWSDIHQQMLELPKEMDTWFEAERVTQLQCWVGSDDDMSVQDREECVHVALAMYAYYGKDATVFSWEDLVSLGRPLLGKHVESVVEDTEYTEPTDIITEQGHICVQLDDGDIVSVEAYQCAYACREAEQWQEDREYTAEGQLAVLQAEFLLSLHIGILRTLSLPLYRVLVATREGQAGCGAVSSTKGRVETVASAEVRDTNQVATVGVGMLLATAWPYLQQLRRVLDSRLYEVRWRPMRSDTCCIVVESQLSGQAYIYDCASQVEDALAAFSTQEAESSPLGCDG